MLGSPCAVFGGKGFIDLFKANIVDGAHTQICLFAFVPFGTFVAMLHVAWTVDLSFAVERLALKGERGREIESF